jgi:hypothetical protein
LWAAMTTQVRARVGSCTRAAKLPEGPGADKRRRAEQRCRTCSVKQGVRRWGRHARTRDGRVRCTRSSTHAHPHPPAHRPWRDGVARVPATESAPFHIVTVFVLLGVGAVAVVFPELATALAHFVGVGRGADLITYIAIVGVMFALIHYDTKFVELQQQVTELTRELALLRSESIGGIKTQLTKPPFSAPHPRPPAAAPPRPAQRWGIFDDLGGVI